MNDPRCPHSPWWLVFIGITPILVLAGAIFWLRSPMDPWAAAAIWGSLIFFYATPGVLIPLGAGVVTLLRVYARHERPAPCLLWALVPGLATMVGSLAMLGYGTIRQEVAESHLWQQKVNTVASQERDKVEEYLTVHDAIISWVDTSDEHFNRRLSRLAGNADACLRQRLPGLAETRRNEFLEWVLDASDANERALRRHHWDSLLRRYPAEYQQHRAQCDDTLNFNTVETRYPNG